MKITNEPASVTDYGSPDDVIIKGKAISQSKEMHKVQVLYPAKDTPLAEVVELAHKPTPSASAPTPSSLKGNDEAHSPLVRGVARSDGVSSKGRI